MQVDVQLSVQVVPEPSTLLLLGIGAAGVWLNFQQLIDTYRTLLDFRIEVHKREAMREQAIASLERAVGGVITSEPAEAPVPPGR